MGTPEPCEKCHGDKRYTGRKRGCVCIKPPPELFLLIFPCGAYRCVRTREGAVSVGQRMANDRVCCERGHDSFEVHIYQPYPPGRSCTAFRGPVRGGLRLA